MSEYSKKYQKYKLKYINLKKQQKTLKGGIINYRFKSKFGLEGSGSGQFSYPIGLAELANGNIAVCDTDNNRIQIFDSSGTFISNFGLFGYGDGQFRNPKELAVLANGNIAVCDSKNNRIQIFDSSGTFISNFGSFGSGEGKFKYPDGLAVLANGNIAVSDTLNNRIQIFDSVGVFKSNFGSQGSGIGQFNDPYGITKLANGNIAVCDTGNNRIQIFDSVGVFISNFGLRGSGDGQFIYPYGIAGLADGNIAVCDSGNKRIQIFDSVGVFINKFGSEGSGDLQFSRPLGLAVFANGNIAVSDTLNNRIQIFSTSTSNLHEDIPVNYRFKSKFGSSGSGNGYFDLPTKIAELADGKIAVSDIVNNRIQIFDSSGAFINKFGSEGSDDGQFQYISGLAVFADGDIAVSDTVNNRIQIFNSVGEFKSKFGSRGSGSGSSNGKFYNPGEIAVLANGNIAVWDTYNHHIQIFDASGTFISKFGSEGSDNGEFNNPRGLAVFANGNIAVCDTDNNRIQIFNSVGAFISKFGSQGSGEGEFMIPSGIAGLADGNIAVCDTNNNRIQIFDSVGAFISKFGSEGSGEGEFKNPRGISTLSNGNIAICDTGNDRVQIFSNLHEDVSENFDEDESENLQNVLSNINYNPWINQSIIYIYYIKNSDRKKIFNFRHRHIFYDYDDEKIEIFEPIHEKDHDIFESLYEKRSTLLIPNSKIWLTFVNKITDVRDVGIDAGGLTKTCFYILSEYLTSKKSPYFEDDGYTKLFKLKNVTPGNITPGNITPGNITPEKIIKNKEIKEKIYFLGQLFGLAIKLKLQIEIELDIFLLYQLIHDDFFKPSFNTDKITSIVKSFNPDLLIVKPYACYNEDLVNLSENKDYCTYIEVENEDGDGYETKILNNIGDIKEETTRNIKLYYESNIDVKAFVDGFRQQIDVQKTRMDKLSVKQLSTLICGIKDINYNTLMEKCNFINFTIDEENSIKKMIRENIDKYPEYIKKLLLVITGSPTIPISGYPSQYPLTIQKNSSAPLPYYETHTCFNQMFINRIAINLFNVSTDKTTTKLYEGFTPKFLDSLNTDYSLG
jgi:tripartite motif-containing protein 71